MNIQKFTAIITKKTEYGESDLILNLFTKEAGSIDVIAKGGRKSKKRFEGGLAPYTAYSAMVATSKYGKLDYLKELTILEHYPRINLSFGNISAAAYATELLREFIKKDQIEENLFKKTVDFYKNIKSPEINRKLLAFYMYDLLNISGFAPEISACVKCGTPVTDSANWTFGKTDGGILCTECGFDTEYPWQKKYSDFLNGKIELQPNNQHFLLTVLADYSEFILGKKLKSRKFGLQNKLTEHQLKKRKSS